MPPVSPPCRLNSDHEVQSFRSGEESLDVWLRKHAHLNQETGASRVFVVCEKGNRVIGYYTLSAGAVVHKDLPRRLKRNMPDPIPVVVLGRLAVDLAWQGRGLGCDLLSDAVRRTLQAADTIGIRAIVVHALHSQAKRFYERAGFLNSPTDPLDLMIPIEHAASHL